MPTRDDIVNMFNERVVQCGQGGELLLFADLIIDVAKQEIRDDIGRGDEMSARVHRLEMLYSPLQARDSDLSREIDAVRKGVYAAKDVVDRKIDATDNSLQRNIETNRKRVVSEFSSFRNEIDARIDALSKAAPKPEPDAVAMPQWVADLHRQVKDLNDAIGRLSGRVHDLACRTSVLEGKATEKGDSASRNVPAHNHDDLNRAIDMVCTRVSNLETNDRARTNRENTIAFRGTQVAPLGFGWVPPRPYVTFGTKNGPAPECKPTDKPAASPTRYEVGGAHGSRTVAASAPQGDREAACPKIPANYPIPIVTTYVDPQRGKVTVNIGRDVKTLEISFDVDK